jgi:peptide/nickel transport system permease protein
VPDSIPAAGFREPRSERPPTSGGSGARRLRASGRQVAWAVLTLVVVSIVTFAATNVRSPKDVARQALGRQTTQSQLDAFVQEQGLDKPMYERYGRWLASFARGDWGVSIVTGRPVRPEIVPRLQKTLILALAALLVALPISLLVGVYMARRWGSTRDLALVLGAIVVSAVPEFVIGIGLLLLFAVTLGWLPVDSTGLSFGGLGAQVEAYVLPTLTLVLAVSAYLVRITRAAAREAFAAPYTRAAVLRGLPRRVVIWDHAMRNAAVPIVNAVAVNLVYLLSGVIVVENVFGVPGIGLALVQAVGHADTITVQAIALVMGAMFIAISFAADLLVIYFNPRLRAAAA